MLYHRPGPAPSQVCTGMHAPAMMVSALELASLPLECVQGRQAGNGSLHHGQRQGWGPSQLCFLHVCALSLAMVAFTLVGSSIRARGSGAGAHHRLGSALGWSWQASQSARQFSICCLHAMTGSKRVCVHSLQEQSLGYLQPSSKPHRFSNQLRGVIHVWLGYLICGLNLLLPREGPLACDIPLLFCVPCQGCGSQSDCFSSPPTRLHVNLYSLGCRRAVPLVSRSISARVPLYVVVVLMCS